MSQPGFEPGTLIKIPRSSTWRHDLWRPQWTPSLLFGICTTSRRFYFFPEKRPHSSCSTEAFLQKLLLASSHRRFWSKRSFGYAFPVVILAFWGGRELKPSREQPVHLLSALEKSLVEVSIDSPRGSQSCIGEPGFVSFPSATSKSCVCRRPPPKSWSRK